MTVTTLSLLILTLFPIQLQHCTLEIYADNADHIAHLLHANPVCLVPNHVLLDLVLNHVDLVQEQDATLTLDTTND